jgi:imidazolonepropionase-like amidohydrolase
LQADYGAVLKDKKADLLLLEANPLEDIKNTQKIVGFIQKGKYLNRAYLDNLLETVRLEVSKLK